MATATPFRIHDENDYSLMASQSRTAKKGLGGGKAPLASATPLVQKTGSKAVLTQKSQRKALSSLSTSNLNARSNLQTPANEGKKAAVKVVQIAEAANEVHLAAEDEHDPLDMVCSGATKWTPMDPYDQVLARVAAREAGAPCTLYCGEFLRYSADDRRVLICGRLSSAG